MGTTWNSEAETSHGDPVCMAGAQRTQGITPSATKFTADNSYIWASQVPQDRTQTCIFVRHPDNSDYQTGMKDEVEKWRSEKVPFSCLHSPAFLPKPCFIPLTGWLALLAPSLSVAPYRQPASFGFRVIYNSFPQNPESSRVYIWNFSSFLPQFYNLTLSLSNT